MVEFEKCLKGYEFKQNFKTHIIKYTFKIKNSITPPKKLFKLAVRKLFEEATKDVHSEYHVGISFSADMFHKGASVKIPFIRLCFLQIGRLFGNIEDVTQSNYRDLCNDTLNLTVTWIESTHRPCFSNSPLPEPDSPNEKFIMPNIKKPDLEGVLFVYFVMLLDSDLQPFMIMTKTNDESKSFENALTCVQDFIEYLKKISKNNKKVVVIEHTNDVDFYNYILDYLLKNPDCFPNNLPKCIKKRFFMVMEVENIRFINLYNYIRGTINNVAETFDINYRCYFPVIRNNTTSLTTEMEYNTNTMNIEELKNFKKWLSTEDGKKLTTNSKKCEVFLNILEDACGQFQEMVLEYNVCPYTEALSISSTTYLIYLRNFLKENTIGLIPKNGYRYNINYSKHAIQWLIQEERDRNISISHCGKTNKKLSKEDFIIDGLCEEPKIIFLFNRCVSDGYLCCKNRAIDCFKKLGYQVVEKCECDFLKEQKLDIINEEKRFYRPLDPRDAMYGGRVETIKTYHKIRGDEKIKYIDINSLYPWVCHSGKFPKGHPEIVFGDDDCRKIFPLNINGLIKCTILPPKNLYHPVLPCKINRKTYFTLCTACTEKHNQNVCDHQDNQRALTGTWVIDEIYFAISKGYIILKFYEIWKYNIEDKQGGLFKEMMNKFIKIKQEASGYSNDTDKFNTIELYKNDFGIDLDENRMTKNTPLRNLAKQFLNTFWGYLGLRDARLYTTIVNNSDNFHKYFEDPSYIVNNLDFITDKVTILNYKYTDNYEKPSTRNSATHSAYVTCQARLKHYYYLENLKERVLYYHTDSVIYIEKPEEWKPEIKDILGFAKDELNGKHITEFISSGPCAFGYKLEKLEEEEEEETVCKIRNITFNSLTSVSYDTLKDKLVNDPLLPIQVKTPFKRLYGLEYSTVEVGGTYIPNLIGRVFKHHTSYPYGFFQ